MSGFTLLKKLDHKTVLIRMIRAATGGGKNENERQLVLLLRQD
jgi:hypothetical protein